MIKYKLETSEIESMIRRCYESDNDLVGKFHVVSGTGLENCVKRTVSDFANTKIYVLENNNRFIGYFGDEDKSLTGFFIMPEFRSNSKEVWNVIKQHFNDDFYVGIFMKNKRAAKFLEKNGCEVHSIVVTNDGIGTVYRFYKEVI